MLLTFKVGFAAVLALVNLTVIIVPVPSSHVAPLGKAGVIVATFAAVPSAVDDVAYIPISLVSVLSTLVDIPSAVTLNSDIAFA